MSAPGVGEATALALLAQPSVLPGHLKAPQVSRHAGLNVRLCQSGSSLNTAGRMSKAGNAYLRAALYMPALSAVRHDPHGFYPVSTNGLIKAENARSRRATLRRMRELWNRSR